MHHKNISYLLIKITAANDAPGHLALDVRQGGADVGGGLRWAISWRQGETCSGFSQRSMDLHLPNSHKAARYLALV